MTAAQLESRFATLCQEDLPLPGGGNTAHRHRRIFAIGREDLSLAKLAEAHWDAVAILREAGLQPAPDARYAVWASEIAGQELQFGSGPNGHVLTGTKQFCSGAGLVDRALMTAGEGGSLLVEVDLQTHADCIRYDKGGWAVDAFRMTRTSAVSFDNCPVTSVVGRDGWYVQRHGFWRGAVGPAAAWAGGAAGLLDYVMANKRDDPHTAAHRAAMYTDVWVTECVLEAVARDFDLPFGPDPLLRALAARHAIEQACTDTLRRFARSMGPAPLARDTDISRRYAELDLFLRQCHAERDLESLGRALRQT